MQTLTGTHFSLTFPSGTSTLDGNAMDNSVVAQRVLDKADANRFAVSMVVQSEFVLNANTPDAAWTFKKL
jgi:hypothetical protein